MLVRIARESICEALRGCDKYVKLDFPGAGQSMSFSGRIRQSLVRMISCEYIGKIRSIGGLKLRKCSKTLRTGFDLVTMKADTVTYHLYVDTTRSSLPDESYLAKLHIVMLESGSKRSTICSKT